MGYSPPKKRSLKFLQQKDNLKRLRTAETQTSVAKKRRRELFKSRTKSIPMHKIVKVFLISRRDIGTEFIDQPIPKSSVPKDETVAAVSFLILRLQVSGNPVKLFKMLLNTTIVSIVHIFYQQKGFHLMHQLLLVLLLKVVNYSC